ncbi:MAG: DHH family phosphoesterase [Candidatus Micrarchaeota archaeon]
MSEFLEKCEEARKLALSFSEPLIVHHHDADGVSSGAIAVAALREAGRKPRTECIKKLDEASIEKLANEKEIIFTDLGGGNRRVNELNDVLIIDHHQTEGIEKPQINPMLFGIDGGDELSASGTAYCVFRVHADLGVVGAVGDMQSPLRGMNRFVMGEGTKSGDVMVENDLRFYGRYCRPLVQFLTYSDDPYIPNISFREDRALSLLSELGIPLLEGERRRVYADLDEGEKTKLISAIARILINTNQLKKTNELLGESYVFPKRPKNETYEANELSTVLNACGRHGRSDVGLRICLGDEDAYAEGRKLLQQHRRMLKQGIEFALGKVQDLGRFYFLDGRGVVDEGIIGIVCGMALRQSWTKPIIGISLGENDTIKASGRAGRALVEGGLNLGKLMGAAGAEAGGIGGGHRIAAGASIPKGSLNSFLVAVGKYFG